MYIRKLYVQMIAKKQQFAMSKSIHISSAVIQKMYDDVFRDFTNIFRFSN